MKLSSIRINIEQPGNYVVYGYDYDLLLINSELAKSNAQPWLTSEYCHLQKIIPEFYKSCTFTF